MSLHGTRKVGIGGVRELLVLVLVLSLSVDVFASTPRDSDADGLSDELEVRTGTDPLSADTDRDGVPDGVEDRDLDGAVSQGESDPRKPGLFPGTMPHIPEPLAFDLVRGLGARRGELEVNTLVLVSPESPNVKWAPEVEWAFADGYAIELELPMGDRELEAVKLALQGTLPSRFASLAHGWQTFVETSVDNGATDWLAVYLLGQRLGRSFSYLTMLGGRVEIDDSGLGWGATVVNASLFYDVREWQTLGLETNFDIGSRGDWTARVLPQLHLQLNQRFRIQLGAGFNRTSNGIEPVGGVRVIIE